MKDTPARIEARLTELYLQRTPSERIEFGCGLYDFAKELVTAALVRENPNLSAQELRGEVFRRFYADDLSAERIERIMHADAARSRSWPG